MTSPDANYPPIENYPAIIEPIVRQIVPGLDVPLDWVIFAATGAMFDGVIWMFPSRLHLHALSLLWAFPWFLLAMRADRRGWILRALGMFSLGWGGSVIILMFTQAYFLQLTAIFTVMFPLLAPLVSFFALCSASRLIDARAPAWIGWVPRQMLALLNRVGALPRILKPAAFRGASV